MRQEGYTSNRITRSPTSLTSVYGECHVPTALTSLKHFSLTSHVNDNATVVDADAEHNHYRHDNTTNDHTGRLTVTDLVKNERDDNWIENNGKDETTGQRASTYQAVLSAKSIIQCWILSMHHRSGPKTLSSSRCIEDFARRYE